MQIVGIKKDKNFYHVAALSLERGQVHIHFVETLLESELKEKIDMSSSCLVAGLPCSDILFRSFTSPIKKKALVKKTLPFKMKELFPFKVVAGLYKVLTEPHPKGFFVSIFASYDQRRVRDYIASYHDLSLDVLSLEPIALYRFALFLEEKREDFLVLHFDYNQVIIEVIEKRRLKRYVSLDISELLIEQSLQQEGVIETGSDKIHLSHYLEKAGSSVVEKLQQKIDRALCFLLEGESKKEEVKVLFTGLCEVFPIEELFFLTREAHFSPIQIGNKQGFHVSTVLSHAIPIGLSLDVLKDDATSCQWLQGDLQPDHHKRFFAKKLKKHALVCCSLLALACSLFFFQTMQAEKRIMKPLDTLFEEVGVQHPPLLGGLNEPSLEGKINFANRVIHKYKLEQTPFEALPKASHFFYYLSELASLKALSDAEGFSMTKVDYEMIQRPTFAAPGKPYRVHVKLKFTSDDHNKALALYEEIGKDKQHIDLKRGVSWDWRKNKYEIGFFFKG